MAHFNRAVASLPGRERIARHPHGGQVFIHATAEETAGAYGIWETFSAPGTGPSRHMHTRETEVFRVIEGNYRFWCGNEMIEAPVGSVVVLPPNVPHHWRNVSDGMGRMMGFVTPGGFEHFFLELERAGAATPEAILPIQNRFGLVEIGDGPDP
ncbi:cupin domain-containing protein [Rhizobium sp. BK379]|uniref:cupin domain-containing protein n=1 Tax=Rhizobium sp. BK379 TaxID=2587059 RepID=UPI000DDE9D35|nr:cupin domain-containing protein [Rhizobium sp. BK379]MBB3441887.1 quercetin dioxygenase-like cupin family protein [Rhizobium sp. BK379]